MAQYVLYFDKEDPPGSRVAVLRRDRTEERDVWTYVTLWGGDPIREGDPPARILANEYHYVMLPLPEQFVDGILALRKHLRSEVWERRVLCIVMGEDFVNDLDLDGENDDGDL